MLKKLFATYKNLSITIKATLWFTVCNILQKGIMFLAVPIYTRIMTVEEYGNYSIFLSWLEIFEILATFRIGWGGYVVGLNKYEDERDSYTSSMQMLSFVITTVALGIYLIFSHPINAITGLSTKFTLLMFGLLYVMPTIQFWSVRERVEYRYKSFLLVTVISSAFVIGFGTIAALMMQEKDFAVILARLIVQGVIAVVLVWCNCHKNFTFYKKEFWQRAIRFNVPLLPYYLSMVVLHGADKIIIGDLVGSKQAGIYGVAYILSTCMQLFSTSITQTLQPWLYKQMKKDTVEEVPRVITLTTAMIAVINLLMIALAPELIRLIAPAKYHEAIWVIPPLAASVVIMFVYQHFVNIEFYFEESKLTAIASIGAAVLNVVLNYLFIPIYGYMVAGYTTLASYLVFCICHYCFMKIVCNKNNYHKNLIQVKAFLVIIAVFFAGMAVLMFGYQYPIIRYVVLFVIVVGCIFNKNKIIKIVKMLAQSKSKK
ncbi:MAG: lipopolysaccharide biosynthesis protein [Lachnospiraceae bacterium]